MKHLLKIYLKKLFNRFGFELRQQDYFSFINTQRRALFDDAVAHRTALKNYNKEAEGIVFTKDRPMQLHALLKSYFDIVENPVPLTILCSTSSNDYEKAYKEALEEINTTYKAQVEFAPVTFIIEKNCRQDLLNILNTSQAKKTFFLVDDIIFIDSFDMAEFIKTDPKKEIATLRMGANITFCDTMESAMPLPQFKVMHDKDMLAFKWDDSIMDWAYPLSTEGHLFDTVELFVLLNSIPFKAPNTMEVAMNNCVNMFSDRSGLCYKRSKLVNNPANRVQHEVANKHGDISAEELLKKWQNGYRINTTSIYGMLNKMPHQEFNFELIQSGDLK